LTYRTILIVVLWFELCRLSQRSSLANCFLPFTFRCCSTIKHITFQIPLKDLSVALLYSQILLPLFSFQGAKASSQSPFHFVSTLR